jgi:hypothetical protein
MTTQEDFSNCVMKMSDLCHCSMKASRKSLQEILIMCVILDMHKDDDTWMPVLERIGLVCIDTNTYMYINKTLYM